MRRRSSALWKRKTAAWCSPPAASRAWRRQCDGWRRIARWWRKWAVADWPPSSAATIGATTPGASFGSSGTCRSARESTKKFRIDYSVRLTRVMPGLLPIPTQRGCVGALVLLYSHVLRSRQCDAGRLECADIGRDTLRPDVAVVVPGDEGVDCGTGNAFVDRRATRVLRMEIADTWPHELRIRHGSGPSRRRVARSEPDVTRAGEVARAEPARERRGGIVGTDVSVARLGHYENIIFQIDMLRHVRKSKPEQIARTAGVRIRVDGIVVELGVKRSAGPAQSDHVAITMVKVVIDDVVVERDVAGSAVDQDL